MRHVTRTVLAVIGTMSASFVLLAAQAVNPPTDPPRPDVLRPGATIERALAPDATLRVTLPLQGGDYVEITVEQSGVDAIVAVTGPDGAAIDEVDDTSELDGPERTART